MTDRRRNLFILLLVAGLLLASLAVIATKKTREGLDLKGGVSLVYQAKPTKFAPKVTGDALQRTLDIMRERVDQLGVAEPEILRSGTDQINVNLPDVKNAAEAERQVGQVAQMFFYDWETNVLGPNDQPDPSNPAVTGGSQAGSGVGALPLYDAVINASKRPVHKYPLDTHRGLYYGLATKQKQVICGPQETVDALRTDCATQLKKTAANRALGLTVNDLAIKKVNEGTVLVRAEQANGNSSQKTDQWYVLNDNPVLRGTDIKNPQQNFDQTQSPDVTFDFTKSGRKIWQQATRKIAQRGAAQNVPGQPASAAFQHFAIVLDQDLISVPYIDFQRNPDGIDATNGSEISGGFTIQSAQRLANLLKTGALPLKLELISQSQVSATLGKQALNQGLLAGAIGFGVVALFLLFFYRILGVIAVTALVVYGVYFFALIKLIPITLTLPGIAGLILTIGVAADANIVIFERVKEEIRNGRSVAAGIATGYKRGIAAIIDANVVTFMTAFILFILATSGVKGFAFTLGIGTLVSLFTAVLATQAVLGTMGRSRMIQSPRALGAGDKKDRWHFDFMGASKWFFSFSGVILLVGALALGGKGLHLGIDFESGTRITAAFTKPTSESQLRSLLSAQGLGDAKIQRVSNKALGNNAFQISTKTLPPTKLTAVRNQLDKQYGFAQTPNSESIGPTFGNTVANSALVAIIASLIVISAYIALRFEWKYAVPVLIALMHDVLITAGVYSLLGREVTTSTVAALLTILGYSLYDTIIVFDRVRENVPRMPRAAFSQIVNRSMSEVLTRSLATTFCTCLPVAALLFFGGATLKDFAFALLVGVISGAYSSIFIASPVLTHWKEREAVYVRRRQRISEALGGVVPAYAVATQGGPIDVEPKRKERSARRITEPELPGQAVSASEFQAMVADIHDPVVPAAKRDPAADALPEDVVMQDSPEKKKRDQKRRGPRNKRHGRAR